MNKTLSQALRESEIELGILRSEMDELLYNDSLKKNYKDLQTRHKRVLELREATAKNLRKERRDNKYLKTRLAQVNLKLEKYEKEKQLD